MAYLILFMVSVGTGLLGCIVGAQAWAVHLVPMGAPPVTWAWLFWAILATKLIGGINVHGDKVDKPEPEKLHALQVAACIRLGLLGIGWWSFT